MGLTPLHVSDALHGATPASDRPSLSRAVRDRCHARCVNTEHSVVQEKPRQAQKRPPRCNDHDIRHAGPVSTDPRSHERITFGETAKPHRKRAGLGRTKPARTHRLGPIPSRAPLVGRTSHATCSDLLAVCVVRPRHSTEPVPRERNALAECPAPPHPTDSS
jgi:hypothetical protein